jgi:chromodomain-helicase-DNA-binding protein 7
MQMFHMSSLKMGLDQAVLQGFESGGSSGEGAMTKEEVERLLRHGAYDIFNEEKAGSADAESNDFVQQDIDSILARRSKTVVHDQTGSNSNAAGGTFSKASFKAPKTPGGQEKAKKDDIDIDDPEFWTKMVGEAQFDDSEIISSGMKRKRMNKNYSEVEYENGLDGTLLLSDSDASISSDSPSDDWSLDDAEPESPDSNAPENAEESPKKRRKKIKKEKSRWGGKRPNEWDKKDAEKVLKALQMYGYGNVPWTTFMEDVGINATRFGLDEVCQSLILLQCLCDRRSS